MLNCDCYIAILETISLCAKKMSSGLFINVTNKMFTNHLICMYKEDLALNNRQWLICHKTQPNQTTQTTNCTHMQQYMKILRLLHCYTMYVISYHIIIISIISLCFINDDTSLVIQVLKTCIKNFKEICFIQFSVLIEIQKPNCLLCNQWYL